MLTRAVSVSEDDELKYHNEKQVKKTRGREGKEKRKMKEKHGEEERKMTTENNNETNT